MRSSPRSGVSLRPAPAAVAVGVRVAQPAEDHPPGAGLQGVGHGELDLLVQVRPALFDDDHRAVVEVADALPGLFARLDEPHVILSPGSTTGLRALARSLMLITSTPRNWATLFRL